MSYFGGGGGGSGGDTCPILLKLTVMFLELSLLSLSMSTALGSRNICLNFPQLILFYVL